MAEQLGRSVILTVGVAVVATARTKTLTINNSEINVTSDGDDGVQRFLAEPGEKSVEVAVEGLTNDDTLLSKAFTNNLLTDLELDFGTFTVSGEFFMNPYSEGMPYNEAKTFSATFKSSGAIVKAAAV